MKKIGVVLVAAIALLVASCSNGGIQDKDPAVGKGATAWNLRGPSAANAYWSEIKDSSKKKKYLNYITLYNAGVKALDSTDGVKASNESKLLSSCNTALAKFNAIDPNLKLPADVCAKGAKLSAGRIDKLLAAEKVSEATKMYNTSMKVYQKHNSLTTVGKEVEICNQINNKKSALFAQADKASKIENFDAKIAAYDSVIASCPSIEAEVNSIVKNSGLSDTAGVAGCAKGFKKVRQDIAIQREGEFRDKIYEFKDRFGEEFARQPEGTGSGKNGSFTLEETLAHYKSVGKNMDAIYDELLEFAAAHPKDVGQDVLNDIKATKTDLNNKIAQINREIANAKEVASRGKTVIPLMIGLFNPIPGTSGANKRSRPAKFSATGVTGNDYWWGMVSIPKGQYNDLVIKVNDNRTVRVFNENTKSGKLIEKNKLQDLVNREAKVGNSWPVKNVGGKLKGSNYFFEVQKGRTANYSGEVTIYSSFVSISR